MSTSILTDVMTEQQIEALIVDPFKVLHDPFPDTAGNVPGPEPEPLGDSTPTDPWTSPDHHAVAHLWLQVPVTLIGEPDIILRDINEVLKPRNFTSDWRIRWERKDAMTKRHNASKSAKAARFRCKHSITAPFLEPVPKRAKLTKPEP